LVDTSRTEKMTTMARRRHRKYTPEYRAEAIRPVNVGDRSLSQVARDLGIRMHTLWDWVHQSEVDAGKGQPEELTTTEKEELKQLRREVARLREEREILKKATANSTRRASEVCVHPGGEGQARCGVAV
jgi:transposase